jgi:hypothetical protein
MANLTVYKYEVLLIDDVIIDLPEGAKVLTFQAQNEVPCIWALVDPNAAKVPRRFRLAGTGHLIQHDEKSLRYVGTAQFHEGALVFHLFEVLQ